MKKLTTTIFLVFYICGISFSQIDTISNNIFQNNGNLGIGTNNPTSRFELVSNDIITYPSYGIFSIKNNHYASIDAFSANNADYIGSFITGRRSRGTITFPQNVQSGDRISGILSAIYYNNEFRFNSSIEFYAGNGLSANSFPSYIVFRTTSVNEVSRIERMRLTEEGFLGLGTSSPKAKLQITNGDIFIEDIDKGIIMKSPDGNCWKGVLNNSGILVFTQIDCQDLVEVNAQQVTSQGNMSIYPNPTKNTVTINVDESDLHNIRYDIYDLNGRMLTQGNSINQNKTINISSFETGIYLIKLVDENGKVISSKKIIKE